MRAVQPPGAPEMAAAAQVVGATLAPTPVVPAPRLGPAVWLKLETFQPTGSFKVRGGLAAVAAVQRRGEAAALVAASAGNHGLGLAYAAARLGAQASVVVAETASPAKIRALERFGITLIRHGASYDEAEAHALALASERGWHFVSPYNDPDVIAGQGTVGPEALAQLTGLATVVVPVGGGGLICGVGLSTAGSGVRVLGVEPERSAAMAAALAAGTTVPIEVGPTMADGLAGNIEEGSVTVGLAARLVAAMVAVSEEEIAAAIRFLAVEHGVVAEGAGAVGVAALLSGKVEPGGAPLVVLVTGRNIAPPLLASVLGS